MLNNRKNSRRHSMILEIINRLMNRCFTKRTFEKKNFNQTEKQSCKKYVKHLSEHKHLFKRDCGFSFNQLFDTQINYFRKNTCVKQNSSFSTVSQRIKDKQSIHSGFWSSLLKNEIKIKTQMCCLFIHSNFSCEAFVFQKNKQQSEFILVP